jgi:uncharacterized membrane protein
MGVLLVGLLLTPGIPLDQKMYMVLHGMCSQDHTVSLGGITFPICARCSGIYITTVITTIYLWAIGRGRAGRVPPWPISAVLLLLVLLMGIDGLNSMTTAMGAWSLYEPMNELRSITGTGMGVGMAVLLMLMINIALRKDVQDQQPVLQSWRELATVLILNSLVLVAIYGNLDFMAWPLAITAFLGMSGVIYAVSLLLVSLFMGYDGAVTSLAQLAKPATLALIPTVVILIGMASLRYWLEAQGVLPAV